MASTAFLGMLDVFAKFETNLRRERQIEGIAKATCVAAHYGRYEERRRVTRVDRESDRGAARRGCCDATAPGLGNWTRRHRCRLRHYPSYHYRRVQHGP